MRCWEQDATRRAQRATVVAAGKNTFAAVLKGPEMFWGGVLVLATNWSLVDWSHAEWLVTNRTTARVRYPDHLDVHRVRRRRYTVQRYYANDLIGDTLAVSDERARVSSR